MTCIFCKIIKGEVAAHKVYEDDLCLAFLDHRPIRAGHTLVIPKTHIDHFCDLDEALSAHIMNTGQKISRKIRTALNPARIGIVVAGFGVPHAHLHVIPMHEEHDITSRQYAYLDNGQIHFSGTHIPVEKITELNKLQNTLKLSQE